MLNSFYTWLQVYVAVRSRGDWQISACIQHREWIGGGFCLFAVVDWERYMWLYRHSRAYINLLIQLGEFGQEVLRRLIPSDSADG